MIRYTEQQFNLELTKDFFEFCQIPYRISKIDKIINKMALLSRNISSREATSRILLLMKSKDNLILKYKKFEKMFNMLNEEILKILFLVNNGYSYSYVAKCSNVSIRTIIRRISNANKKYIRRKNGKI